MDELQRNMMTVGGVERLPPVGPPVGPERLPPVGPERLPPVGPGLDDGRELLDPEDPFDELFGGNVEYWNVDELPRFDPPVNRRPPQVTQERFVDRMEQVYGRQGLSDRVDVVNERLRNRPKILDLGGMSKFNSERAYDRVPTLWSKSKPEILNTWGEKFKDREWGLGYRLQGVYDPTEPKAYVHSLDNQKPRSPFTDPGIRGILRQSFGKQVPGKPAAYMDGSSTIANHELGHHVYEKPWTGAPKNIANTAKAEAEGDLLSKLRVSGDPGKELPVYLADVVRWYANRNLDPKKLASDPEYRLNAKRDIPVTEKDHARAWDAFGEMIKQSKESQWGDFDYDKWEEMNKERDRVLRILPELVQTSDLQSSIIA